MCGKCRKTGKCGKYGIHIARLFLTALFILALSFSAAAADVEYGNLRQLLTEGNAQLKQNSYYSTKENLEFQISMLESECGDMLMYKKMYQEEDPEAAEEYGRAAAAMSATLKNLRRRLNRMNTEAGSNIDETIDSLEMTAQTRMNSYNQMAAQAASKELACAAAVKSYENTVLRYNAGAATEAQVSAAYNTMLQQQNELESYRQQVTTLRRNLLQLFGMSDTGTVTIGASPEPDLAAIAAVDFAADRERAINSSSAVRQARHSSFNSAFSMEMKALNEQEAMGNAENSITDSYNQMQARLTEYQAAIAGWGSAQSDYAALERRRQAGMVTEADFLSGQAKFHQAQARFTSASISLLQAYNNYKWEVEGIG